MAYQGFSGSGTVGNFASTTILQNMYPAARYAGRRATVETNGLVYPYFSNGSAWVPEVTVNAAGTSLVSGDGSRVSFNGVRNVAIMGDSINQQATNAAGGTNTLDRGIVPWMLCYLGWPWNFEPEDNFAVAGTGLDVMISTQLPLLAAANATKNYQRVFVSAGTNDTNAAVDVATIQSRFTTLFAGIRALGAIPVVWGILPRGIDGAITNAKRQNQRLNEWLYLQSLAGVCEYADIGENVADNSTDYGNALTTMMYDSGTNNLHPNARGANLLGRALASYYTARGIGPLLKFATQQGDKFDRTNNPAGVAFNAPNPLMQGGTTAPTGMTTSGGTWSNVSRTLTNGQTREDRQCVLAASTTHYIYDDWTASGAWSASQLQPGDVIEGRAIVEIASGVNISNINLQLAENDGSTSTQNYCLGQIDTGLINGAYVLYLKTPRITVRPYSGSGNALIFQRLNIVVAAGGSGTALVKAFEVRKVG